MNSKRNITILTCILSLLFLPPIGGLRGSLGLASVAFRGAWIATVANIDWPSPEAVGNTSEQQSEMIFLLDSLQSIGINAIIFQVRPTADALYDSQLEPVSHWLTQSLSG